MAAVVAVGYRQVTGNCNHLLGLVKDNWAQIRAEKAASSDGESHTTSYVSTSPFALLHLWADMCDEVAPW